MESNYQKFQRGAREKAQKAESGAMEVVKVISEHKRHKIYREGYTNSRPKAGMRRVEAIVKIKGYGLCTRHIDVPKK